MLWTEKAKKFLRRLKIDDLKDKQIEAINKLLLGNDVIGLLPTGYGKSLCYLLPPLITKKTIFIISPLISLMDDQKEKLDKINIPCATLHTNNKNKHQEILEIKKGNIKIVYMSPEYLVKSDGLTIAQNLVENNILGFLAIDESHCVSSWGSDFRPEYTNIKTFRELFPSIPIIALTATATNIVCKDITKILNLNNPAIVKASFDRPNLYISVRGIPNVSVVHQKTKKIRILKRKQAKEHIVLSWTEKYPGEKIIVYINSRKKTEELAEKLNNIDKNFCNAYHAGLSKENREIIQNKFLNGEIKVIISTIAFGMGIDQKIRAVIIFGCPSSIEEYYQQIGRAGRDNIQSNTVLYFDYSSVVIAKYMIKDIKFSDSELYNFKIDNINRILKFAYLNTCRRKYILEYFNESCNFFTCRNCDNCCEQSLVDITDNLWSNIMKPNVKVIDVINDFKKKYLTDIIEIDTNNKERNNYLDLFDPVFKWRKYIIQNNITLDNLPDNLRIKIPSKFIKKIENKKIETFEDKINIYEKLL